MMKKILPAIFLASSLACVAKDAVEVERVNFKKTKDKWVQMEIQISCHGNFAPDARDKRFLEDIAVTAYIGYVIDEKTKEFDFYKAKSKIVMMEQGKDVNVYFYLPGMIVDRDRLDNDPEYYFVDVSVQGVDLPPQEDSFGSRVNEAVYNSMKSRADASKDTEHLLMPYYLTPPEFRGPVSELPIYLRPDTVE